MDPHDLYVLVADKDLRLVIDELLARSNELEFGTIKWTTEKHREMDSGCCRKYDEYLRSRIRDYRNAIVVFDKHGSGRERETREEIQDRIERDMGRNGWSCRCKAIVIEPELESWVWNGSNTLAQTLGWQNHSALKTWLRNAELWPDQFIKPPDPKAAMNKALKKTRTRASPRIFQKLAGNLDPTGCTDPAFVDLVETLRKWFPKSKD